MRMMCGPRRRGRVGVYLRARRAAIRRKPIPDRRQERETMATTAREASPPGFTVGPTSEFSLFFRVKPGDGAVVRAALRDLQETPGYRPGDYGMAISSIHEARFVLFDDDTRLAFITSFDGPWDAYMEDFFTSGPTLALFDAIFRHTEGYDGLPDLAAVKALCPRRAADGCRLRPQLRRHGQGSPQGAACQRGLPAGARPPRCRRGAAAPGAQAAARRGRLLVHVRPHLRTASAVRPDRRHHRRVRLPEPGAAGPPRARHEHAPVRQAVGRALRGADLPLPAAAAHAGRDRRRGAIHDGRRGGRVRLRVLGARA